MWTLLGVVALFGAIGGVVNALMTDKGFSMPSREVVDAITIVKPGWMGNVIIGAIAATISWGLYGPFADRIVIGGPTAGGVSGSTAPGLTLAALVGAILVGIGGARWLTNEVDKTLLKAAATKAAGANSAPALAQQIALATPAQALEIAKTM